jgi:hypothetical protein
VAVAAVSKLGSASDPEPDNALRHFRESGKNFIEIGNHSTLHGTMLSLAMQ